MDIDYLSDEEFRYACTGPPHEEKILLCQHRGVLCVDAHLLHYFVMLTKNLMYGHVCM